LKKVFSTEVMADDRPLPIDYLHAELVWPATCTAVFCQCNELPKSHAALIMYKCIKRNVNY
jgi:hypothetical protein